jgi:hypothetical protein
MEYDYGQNQQKRNALIATVLVVVVIVVSLTVPSLFLHLNYPPFA